PRIYGFSMPVVSVTSPTLRRLSLTKPVASSPMRVGTVTDHFAASKADDEGGDYSPEAEPAGIPMPSRGPGGIGQRSSSTLEVT
ncbi:MAG: hypothetical protein ACXWYS_05940, partial [Gaiellaceae bacterium]